MEAKVHDGTPEFDGRLVIIRRAGALAQTSFDAGG
jgi:hypothetical protein